MATSGEPATRGLPQPLDILSRKLQKGRRRHTTDNLGSVQKLAKGFTIDTGVISRHESMDYGERIDVRITEDAANDQVCICFVDTCISLSLLVVATLCELETFLTIFKDIFNPIPVSIYVSL